MCRCALPGTTVTGGGIARRPARGNGEKVGMETTTAAAIATAAKARIENPKVEQIAS